MQFIRLTGKNKNKNDIILSICAKNVFGKIQHTFIIKIINKLEVAENFLNLLTNTYKIPAANFTLNVKD